MARSRLEALVRQFRENGIKFLLEDPYNVRDLLAVAHETMRDHIDFDHLAVERTTFVQRDYRHIESDLVLRAPLRWPGMAHRQLTIYILVEHQSEPDPFMTFRVHEYVIQIYKAQLRAWGQSHPSFAGLRFQPVLPIVLYTGRRRWPGLGRLLDLVELGDHFGARIPALEPLFLNLSAIPARRLESEGGFFGWVLRLMQERHARPGEFASLLRRVVLQLEQMPAKERQRWLELLSYVLAMVYHERNPSEHEALQAEVEASVQTDRQRREVAAMGKTIADALMAKGRRQGRKEEAIRARQQTLLRQMELRFGTVPAEIVKAIEATRSVEILETWLERFVTAETLKELGIERK